MLESILWYKLGAWFVRRYLYLLWEAEKKFFSFKKISYESVLWSCSSLPSLTPYIDLKKSILLECKFSWTISCFNKWLIKEIEWVFHAWFVCEFSLKINIVSLSSLYMRENHFFSNCITIFHPWQYFIHHNIPSVIISEISLASLKLSQLARIYVIHYLTTLKNLLSIVPLNFSSKFCFDLSLALFLHSVYSIFKSIRMHAFRTVWDFIKHPS